MGIPWITSLAAMWKIGRLRGSGPKPDPASGMPPPATTDAASPKPVTRDTNHSYCLRLAEVTIPLLDTVALAPSSTVAEEIQRLFGPHSESLGPRIRSREDLAALLELRPDVQSRLAVITQYTPSKWLLERELEACNYWPDPPSTTAEKSPCYTSAADSKPDAYNAAMFRSAAGLCLSGGGIRSATFNLGILQALSRHSRIRQFDYISSVSGGGYIHQFLANWITRSGSTSSVEALLDSIPNEPGPTPLGYRATVQPEPLRWLRRYSNYLAPRKGIFSLDSWTIVATWTRNTALNLIVLLSSLFFVLLLPHLGTLPFSFLDRHTALLYTLRCILTVVFSLVVIALCVWLYDITPPGLPPIYMKLACASLLGAAALVSPALYHASVPGSSIDSEAARRIFAPTESPVHLHYQGSFQQQTSHSELLQVVVDSREPEPHSRIQLSARPPTFWNEAWSQPISIPIFLFALLCDGLFIAVLGANNADLRQQKKGDAAPSSMSAQDSDPSQTELSGTIEICRNACVFFIGLIFAYLLLQGVRLLFFFACFAVPANYIPALGVALLPTLLLGVPFFMMETALGLIGRGADSGQREWLARLRAFSFLLGGSWCALALFSLLGPYLFHLISGYATTSYAIWSGWIGTTIAGVLSARSSRTDAGKTTGVDKKISTGVLLNLLAKIAPPVFIAGLLILLATFVEWSLTLPHPTLIQHEHRFLLLTFVSLSLALLFGWRIDVNDFSMHAFYRDRLARCYAGAVDPHRVPNLFTGFTRDDRSLRVHQLLPKGYCGVDNFGQPVQGNYDGPFPIFCTSINLTFGEDLAYQERKAASFAFTPLYSGYNVGWTSARSADNQFNGFVDTPSYAYSDTGAITLATACAISGAAASPSMGYHSDSSIAFLLTVFNVRLGWWLRNPRRRHIGRVTPYPIPTPPSDTNPDRMPPIHHFALKIKAFFSRTFPLKPGTLSSSPRFGLLRLLNELFGRSDDTTSYIYLTDGGHFDNMGLYELLRRRCRTIVVCDSEADPHLNFEGIGMAIRKARLDFGVEITLDQISPVADHGLAAAPLHEDASPVPVADFQGVTDPARPSPQAREQNNPPEAPYIVSAHLSATDSSGVTGTISRHPHTPVAGLSSFEEFPGNSVHCVHGTIRYPEDESPDQFGHILYIKASLTGDEPPDLINYRRQHERFPHDTTLKQFFSESQFESYRRLGEHIVLTDQVAIRWLSSYLKPRPRGFSPAP